MANSKAITTTFWDISATFSGNSKGAAYIGTMVFAQEVAIGSLMNKDWQAAEMAIPFPYGKEKIKAFTGKSFQAEWIEATRIFKIYLTDNQYWYLLAQLDGEDKLVKYCLVFEPKQEITIKKFPGIQAALNKFIQVDITIYLACQAMSVNDLTIQKGISFASNLQLGDKKIIFPSAANTLINCSSTNTPISIGQSLGGVAEIDTLGFEYRPAGKNATNGLNEPSQLFLELKMKNTALDMLKGKLKTIRIGFILDKLHLMQRFSWESNLSLEVDFNIPVMNKKTNKRQIISLRPMQWLRKIGFPPSWFPSIFKKNTPRPNETKGITITKAELENIELIKSTGDYQSLIPDKTVLERVVYDWKTHDLEMAVQVNFQSPLSQSELQELEQTHTEAAALLAALQKEAIDRGIDTANKSIEELKIALNQYTGGFPLNKYPEIFKVNQVAIYINTSK